MKKIFASLILILWFFSGNSYADLYYGSQKKIIPIGDSLSGGTGDATGNVRMGYRDHLIDELGSTYTVLGSFAEPITATGYSTYHSGVGSNSTAQIEERSAFEVGRISTKFFPTGSSVVLWSGTNDACRIGQALAGWTRVASVQNIQDTLDVIRLSGLNLKVYVVNLGPNGTGSCDTEMTGFNTSLLTMLTTYQASYPSFNIIYVNMKAMIQSDTFGLCGGAGNFITNCYADTTHFNDTGYTAVAKQIAACIKNPAAANCTDI